MQQYLQVGYVSNTHGVKGEIKVMPLTDNTERFNDLPFVYVERGESLLKYPVQYAKLHKGQVLLKLKGIEDMDSAEGLKGQYLLVDRENAVKLPEDSFFICDIINCRVSDINGKELGILKDVLKTGSNDVYVVQNENKGEILIPALKSVIKEISVEEKRMVVDLPKGLLDDEI